MTGSDDHHHEGKKARQQAKDEARMAELNPILESLKSDDKEQQLAGLRDLRTQLEGAHPPRADIVIHAGFIPKLLELAKAERHELQFESLWILTDLTAGDARHTKEIVELGALASIEPFLLSPSASAREQALEVFANVAGASVELRDKVMATGVIKDVLRMLHVGMANEHQTYYDEAAKVWRLRAGEPEQPVSVTKKGAICMSRLCQGDPAPALGEGATDLLMALATLIMETDEEVLVNALTALAALKYGTFEYEFMVKDGVDARLSDLAAHKSADVSDLAKTAAEKLAAAKSG
mmetsp:Transcript_8908/g.19956  ORF Transcript_8908/g.19956 Transcript_8908/m.19956 type:complete len:294 (-) Transcript_8908:124-1005(-)|eukprot:CAMPEP_0178430808 /NCGR_PEP_ID=MMETSP0689_2-20121128/31513_1 /TAXON_ID=160604 /ORGANISM="Amphidinium massartii, Strain CS-259" /LENGTH=293 /DNA_ID=CAMNT_0020052681 /DNA_START=125 /DNA_END=1006 /DNA_ORIENTATION=-